MISLFIIGVGMGFGLGIVFICFLLKKEIKQLQQQLAEAKELNAFITKGSFKASQVMATENAHLREQLAEAKKERDELKANSKESV